MEIDLISSIIAAIASTVAVWQFFEAKQAKKELQKISLFQEFSKANEIISEYPYLLRDVHGVDENDEECRSIAYLSILIDSFEIHANGDFSFINSPQSNFLDKIASVPQNKDRWKIMRKIYYGEYDKDFLKIIDSKFGL